MTVLGEERVTPAERLIANRQRALVERFGARILTLETQYLGEAQQTNRESRMLRLDGALVDGQGSLKQRFPPTRSRLGPDRPRRD
jgi:hypothetical protein